MSDQLSLLQEAAARSVARQEKRKEEVSPPPPEPGTWEGVIKKTPTGKIYRLYTIPLADLPAFLERKDFESKMYFRYPPEVEFNRDGTEIPYSGDVLGVRRRDDEEAREL